MERTTVSVSILLPETPEEWNLYEQSPPFVRDLAARALTQALRFAIWEVSSGTSVKGAYRTWIAPVAGRYEAVGACDSGVREISMQILTNLAKFCGREEES